MGRLTRAQIVSEGLLFAGNTQLTARANVWLNNWLASQYANWPWPFLIARSPAIALPAGTQSITVGSGYNGINDYIQSIIDPIYIYSADRRTRYQCRLRQSTNAPVEIDQDTITLTTMGVPTLAKMLRPTGGTTPWGTWQLYFSPLSGPVDYLCSFDYYFDPASLDTSTTDDSVIPLYPNDRTMIQAVYVDALRYMDRQDKFATESSVLTSQILDDRMKFGQIVGTNDRIGLDSEVYGGPNFNGAF